MRVRKRASARRCSRLNGHMHSRHWTRRCIMRDPTTGAWCSDLASDGALCYSHGKEFRSDEAAKAATRLAIANNVIANPNTTAWQRRWATIQARRARTLRRKFLGVDNPQNLLTEDFDRQWDLGAHTHSERHD